MPGGVHGTQVAPRKASPAPFSQSLKRKHFVEQHEIDQSLEVITDSFPPAIRRFYKNLINSGFNTHEAMELTKTWISTMKPEQR